MRFAAGQRWISEPEPELGLGIVLDVEPGRVRMFFPASNAIRLYAAGNAPLRRVRYKVGDTVCSHEGERFTVHIINERSDGVLTYGGVKGERLIETQLSDTLTFDKPGDRLAAGQIDDMALFELRLEALRHQHRTRKSLAYGFSGARIDLIPHQLSIAHEVSRRHAPRVLLADEVGLGKTIEACLVLHRLLLTGRASRVLILVPEPLVHQWFVELLRRFNLLFAIFDEERCTAIEENNEDSNPFLDDQLVLCPVSWLAHDSKRFQQAAGAEWDLIIVDEAHHLAWAPGAPSAEYKLVETLGLTSSGLLLLTATPQQLGPEGHFARLRLLDPDRYPSLDQFLAEAEEYEPVAKIADKLVERKKLTAKECAKLEAMPGRITEHAKALQAGDDSAREQLLEELLDQHGTGRVMFRNTRAALSGFPKRIAKLIPLEGDSEAALADYCGESFDVKNDARVAWLVGFVKKLKTAKALVICRTREKAEAVEAAVRDKINAPIAVFHEGLTLLQRDRNAAYFADEEGAQILICSEIGSEGRNFQFAHHLVLFDLPDNPELLEQRIGRLDRIGQTADIQVHVPYVAGGPFEALARWYHEGLNAFEQSLAGGAELYARFGERLREVAMPQSATGKGRKKKSDPLDELIAETAKAQAEIREKLAAGQDRLLELNSRRPRAISQMLSAIQSADQDTALDDFMLRVFDTFSVHVEDLAPRTWIVIPGSGVGESFPGIPAEGITLTADRRRALSLEDVAYLTWDHPAVRGAFELLLGSPKGNSSIGIAQGPEEAIVMEAVYVLEVVAPENLHTDHFLPATPVSVAVSHRMDEYTEPLENVENGPVSRVLGKTDITFKLIPRMLERSLELAETRSYQMIAQALTTMQAELGNEIDRLKDLKAVNPNVRDKEIEAAEQYFYDMRDRLAEARLRFDSVRLIFVSPK